MLEVSVSVCGVSGHSGVVSGYGGTAPWGV